MINYIATDEKILIQKNFDKRIVWLDVVRLVAMFTVVCCHCTDPFNFYPGTSPDIGEIKFWGAAYGALLRPCVPLFVMITGALLLPVRGDISAFYRKRILRVFVPFLIWGVLYALFPWITGVLGLDSKVILDFFPYSGEEVMRQSLFVDRVISLPSYILSLGGSGIRSRQAEFPSGVGSHHVIALRP